MMPYNVIGRENATQQTIKGVMFQRPGGAPYQPIEETKVETGQQSYMEKLFAKPISGIREVPLINIASIAPTPDNKQSPKLPMFGGMNNQQEE